MVQLVEMTDDEKFNMYMKVPHEDLVKMKIEEEKYVKYLEDQLNELKNPYVIFDGTCSTPCSTEYSLTCSTIKEGDC